MVPEDKLGRPGNVAAAWAASVTRPTTPLFPDRILFFDVAKSFEVHISSGWDIHFKFGHDFSCDKKNGVQNLILNWR